MISKEKEKQANSKKKEEHVVSTTADKAVDLKKLIKAGGVGMHAARYGPLTIITVPDPGDSAAGGRRRRDRVQEDELGGDAHQERPEPKRKHKLSSLLSFACSS